MTKPCILVVDDEPDLIWAVQQSLTRAGYDVLTSRDGLEALAVARRHHPALVIMDVNMPVMDGLETCLQMRKDPILASTPILLLTVDRTTADKVQGLDHGADDYITKPFDLNEFEAHIRALLRRDHAFNAPNIENDAQAETLIAGEITLFLHTRMVRVQGNASELTPTEYDLLYFLMTHPQKVFTSQQLLQMVWNYPVELANPGLARWHIKNLRNKLESDPKQPAYIVTVARQGYMFKDSSAISAS